MSNFYPYNATWTGDELDLDGASVAPGDPVIVIDAGHVVFPADIGSVYELDATVLPRAAVSAEEVKSLVFQPGVPDLLVAMFNDDPDAAQPLIDGVMASMGL